MTVFGLSIVGILAATFIGMVLGALWYSPLLFGPHWLRAIDKTPDTIGDSTTPMIGSVIASAMSAKHFGYVCRNDIFYIKSRHENPTQKVVRPHTLTL